METKVELFHSGVKEQVAKFLDCIIAYIGLLVAYLIIYRDVVFFPKLVAGIDFQVNSSGEPWRFYFTDWSIWSSLGSRAGLGWTSWGGFQNAIFGAISFGNEVLAQKLMLSGILVASFAMFFFLKNHVTKITPVAFTGAILYAYSPLTTSNYGTGLIWELAYLPIVMNYLFNIFREKASFKDGCLLAIASSFMIGFGAHVVPFVLLTILLLLFAFFPTNRLSIRRFVSSLKYLTLAAFVFVIMNPDVVNTAVYLLLGRTTSLGYTGLPQVSPQSFIAAYSSWTVLQQLTLINWLGWASGVSVGWAPLGIVFSIIAFASLLFSSEKGLRKLVYVFSAAYVLVILFVVNVQQGTDLFLWIFAHFPFIQIISRNTVGPSWFMGFVLATLITVTVSKICSKFVKPVITKQVMNSTRMWPFSFSRQTLVQRLKLISLLSILLLAYFTYVPSFSPATHVDAQQYFGISNTSEPIPDPQVYTMIIDFLQDNDAFGSDRYFLVPFTFLAGSNLLNVNPNIFGPSISPPTPQVARYLSYVDNLIAENETTSLGTLLAPANVKYIVVIRNSTEPNSVMGTMEGAPTQITNGLAGNPKDFIDFLSRQTDLELVEQNQYCLIYENLSFLPYIACFPSMTYVVGDLDVMSMLSTLPSYNVNNSLLFFGDDDLEASQSAFNVSSHVLFYNRATTDFLMSLLYDKYGISVGGLGTTNASTVAEDWVWVDDTQGNSGYLIYGNGYLETTSQKSLGVQFQVNSTGSYGVWARLLYSTYSEGTLSFEINGVSLEKSLNLQTYTDEGFLWTNVGNLTLTRGQSTLTIESQGGYCALSGLIIAPNDEIANFQSLVSAELSSKQAIYVYDATSPLVNVVTKENGTAISGNWGGWGNFSISTDRVVGNCSYLSQVMAGPQNSFGALIGCSFSTVEDWNDEDYVQIWIKSSTPTVQFTLFSDKEASNPISYWQFTVTPNTWTSLQIPLNHYNYGAVGAFQVHAVTSNVNETVELYVNQVSVGRVLETSYTVSAYLSQGNYSVAITPSSPVNASLISIDLGGNLLSLTNEDMNWLTSNGVILEGGTYNLTVTLPGDSEIGQVAIVTGSLNEFWGKNENLDLNYTTEGYSSYSVTTNSNAPFFISLGEAFDVGWQTSLSNEKTIHFEAFSLTNAFYIPETGSVTLNIDFSPSTYVLLNRIALASFVGIITILVANIIYRKIEKRRSSGFKTQFIK
jgi:hypothetical protein